MKRTRIFLLAGLAFGLAVLSLPAQEQTVEDQLRQALREVTVQLRQAQTDLGVARAEVDSLTEDKEKLGKQLEKLTRESAAEQAAAQANINNLNAQLEEKTAEASKLADLLGKWREAYGNMKVVAMAEKERKDSSLQREQELRNEISRLKADNRELYRTGMEILERYESFGLGTALTAREPFTGITRTHLQNLVQDYADELADSRISVEVVGDQTDGGDEGESGTGESDSPDGEASSPDGDTGHEPEAPLAPDSGGEQETATPAAVSMPAPLATSGTMRPGVRRMPAREALFETSPEPAEDGEAGSETSAAGVGGKDVPDGDHPAPEAANDGEAPAPETEVLSD